AAATLTTARGQMAKEMADDLAKAIAEGRVQLAGQQTMRSKSEQPSSAASDKATAKQQDGGKGQGFRGTGPTDFEPRQIEADLESGEWARLPERQREEVLQALREKYPTRYERALIRYYRNLSRLEAKP
ncbi:hypothetical protein FJY63_14455, partial [Candidatus Sumerlaeota bacterium]|nr:hypothetical protein [Candidatus Sumerlaeota bacterium]